MGVARVVDVCGHHRLCHGCAIDRPTWLATRRRWQLSNEAQVERYRLTGGRQDVEMPWTPRGAHILLQVRTSVLTDDFHVWYPGFTTKAEELQVMAA